jgi:hypothetical protein
MTSSGACARTSSLNLDQVFEDCLGEGCVTASAFHTRENPLPFDAFFAVGDLPLDVLKALGPITQLALARFAGHGHVAAHHVRELAGGGLLAVYRYLGLKLIRSSSHPCSHGSP